MKNSYVQTIIKLSICTLISILLVSPALYAKDRSIDSKELKTLPVDIKADKLSQDNNRNLYIAEGNAELHQGTRLCPADFVLPLTTHTGMPQQHRRLVANCLAQSRTMMVGRPEEEARQALLQRGLPPDEAAQLAPHLAMPGNRPNSVITLQALTPETLGALLALYEHRTFCSGQLWGLNPFDQWGVELGKEIGVQILGRLDGDAQAAPMDPSTEALISAWEQAQPGPA